MANEFRTAQPVEYYRKFLEKDVRPDGRELGEFRSTVLNIGCINTAEGSALVKLGNTTVMCGIKAELAAPKTESAEEGYMIPNVELPPLCSSKFRPGPPSEQAQVMSQFMQEVLLNSRCIHCEDLCITPGKLVWVLFCDLVCLDYDGNIIDACILALLAALKNTMLPTVVIDEETDCPGIDTKQLNPLKVYTNPISTTLCIFDNNILFVDPTIEEENLATGMITVVIVEDKICLVHKPGGSPLQMEQLQKCFDRAFERKSEAEKLVLNTLSSVGR